MAYYAQKDPDLQATEKIYRKIMSTGRDTGRFSNPSPSGSRKSGHPSPRKTSNHGIKAGHSSSRGGVVLGEKQMNRHFPDPNEALKRTHDGVVTHRNLSPSSTVRTGQSSKKRAVSNSHSPVKSSTGHLKKDKHLTGVSVERKILDIENTDRWNQSYQALRLEKEWTELDNCRNMKRNSEIVRHRVDNMYMMSGSGIRLRPKYDVNESELQQLKDLSRARQVLRDKAKKQPFSKGRQSRTPGSVKVTDPSHQEIHIHGDAPKDGSSTENPSGADWASDPGSRPNPTPRTPPGKDGDAANGEGNPEVSDKDGTDGKEDQTKDKAPGSREVEGNESKEETEIIKEEEKAKSDNGDVNEGDARVTGDDDKEGDMDGEDEEKGENVENGEAALGGESVDDHVTDEVVEEVVDTEKGEDGEVTEENDETQNKTHVELTGEDKTVEKEGGNVTEEGETNQDEKTDS